MKQTIFNLIIGILIAVMFYLLDTNVSIKAEEVLPEPTPTIIEKVIYEEPDTPEEYIKYIFGEDADKAFLLLKGNDECGGENFNLEWDAQNYNDDPQKSVDIGIFQINEYWHKINRKWLFNWKINIEIAHQLYKENGDSFKLWTAGKCLGI